MLGCPCHPLFLTLSVLLEKLLLIVVPQALLGADGAQ